MMGTKKIIKAKTSYNNWYILLSLLFISLSLLCFLTETPGGQRGYDSQKTSFRLAMVQMEVVPGKLDDNINRATLKIREAANNGAKVALLPEVMDLGWTDPSAKILAFEIPGGKTFERLKTAAIDNEIYVCAGIVERDHENVYNTAVLIGPEGSLLLKHRKLNILNIGQDLYAQGDHLGVVHTPLGTIGLHICADASAYANTLSYSLGYMGADLILSPSLWAVPPDYDNEATPYGDIWKNSYSDVSKRFDLWIVGVSNVGKVEKGAWANWDCIGNSLVYAPGGVEIVEAPYGVYADTIIYTEITPTHRPARGTNWNEFWKKTPR